MGGLLVVLVAAVVAFAAGTVVGRLLAPPSHHRELADTEAQLRQTRLFLSDLRDTIWEHRESAPLLADVVLDDLRTFERTGHTKRRPEELT